MRGSPARFFRVLALVLGSVGIFGLLAHLVARRTNEIGRDRRGASDHRYKPRAVARQAALIDAIQSRLGLNELLRAASYR